jgi:ferric-dicitrate binding protein FerR (iron transport regulator)
VRVEVADTTQALAWTRGRLAFVSTPLEEVARELERWFDVTVEVEPSIATRRLTGEFGSEPGSLDDILLTISAATDVRHERADGRVVLRARR